MSKEEKKLKKEKKGKRLLYDVYEKPPALKWLVLALQHVFAMFGATILVPILVNDLAGAEVLTIPVTLVASGIGTLIYIVCTKGRSPVYLGSSFAFISPMVLGFAKAGTGSVLIGTVAVGLVYVIFAIVIKFVGKDWIDKLLPPIIIGPMIMIIGLGLAPSAISQIGIVDGAALEWQSLVVALITFLTTVCVATFAKGFLKIIPFLTGIIVGYLAAVVFGMIDFTPVVEASFFAMPSFKFPWISYTPNLAALATIVPVAIVTICEHLGDHKALSVIMDRDLTKDPGLDRTLMGDGIATSVAGLIGGPANTTYGENTAVVGMTKIASVWVIGLAAIIAIGFGFLGKLTALFETIPAPVLGGISILLYGYISVNGLKVLVRNNIDFDKNKNVIIAATMLVLGLGGAVISFTVGSATIAFSGMSLAAIIGIILNLVLPEEKEENA